MADDLRDKFGSDDEYDNFKKSYDDFKNKQGMFGQPYSEDLVKMVLKFQELMYKNFILEKKKFFQVPSNFLQEKNLPLYVFYFEKMTTFDETISLILN